MHAKDKKARPKPLATPPTRTALPCWPPRSLSDAVKNYSERTVENRQNYLRYFVLWCGERGIVQPAEVSKAVLERYQRWLYHYRKEKASR